MGKYSVPEFIRNQKPKPVPADPQTPLTAADIFEAVQEKATRISGETDRRQPEKGKIKGQEIE